MGWIGSKDVQLQYLTFLSKSSGEPYVGPFPPLAVGHSSELPEIDYSIPIFRKKMRVREAKMRVEGGNYRFLQKLDCAQKDLAVGSPQTVRCGLS